MKKSLLLAVALCCLPYPSFAQNKIDSSKDALNSDKSSGRGSSSGSSSSSDDDDDTIDEDSFGGEIFFAVFDYTIGVAWFMAVGDYENEMALSDNGLAHYPYEYPQTGNYYSPDYATDSIATDAFRFDVQDKVLYSYGSLYGNHLQTKIRPWRYFYFSADYYQIREEQKALGTHDDLSVFYFNFAYDRIRLERFNLGWTLGAGYVGSGVNRAGISYGLNAEYFFKKRISLMASAKFSHINQEPVHAYEAEIRRHSKNFFMSLGYEHLQIAGPNYNFVSLGAGFYF